MKPYTQLLLVFFCHCVDVLGHVRGFEVCFVVRDGLVGLLAFAYKRYTLVYISDELGKALLSILHVAVG